MIDIQRYQNVATGNTLSECEKSYKSLLRSNGITPVSGSSSSAIEGSITGKIISVSPVVLDGNTHYYLLIEGSNSIYDCPIASVIDVVRYKEGDTVTLSVDASTGNLITVNAISAA